MATKDKTLLKLIRKARLGNKEAFNQLIQRKSRTILYLSIRLMGNKHDGEDAAQEAVITLAKKIGTLKKAELFDAWMYRLVYNTCMDEKRKLAKKLYESDEFESAADSLADRDRERMPEQSLEDASDKEFVMAALDKLSDRYRMCMILYYYEDMSYAEIAEIISANEQIVANTLNRARQKMRDILANSPNAPQSVLATFRLDEASQEQDATHSQDVEMQDSDALYETASKGGAFTPAAFFAQAIAANEASVVSEAALSRMVAVAQGVVMPKGLFRAYVSDGTTAKKVAGGLSLILVSGLGLYAYVATKPETDLSNQQPMVASPSAEGEPEEKVLDEEYEVSVVGLPEGANYRIYEEGEESVDAQPDMAGYSEVTSTEEAGKRYVLYQNSSDELDYVMIIESE